MENNNLVEKERTIGEKGNLPIHESTNGERQVRNKDGVNLPVRSSTYQTVSKKKKKKTGKKCGIALNFKLFPS